MQSIEAIAGYQSLMRRRAIVSMKRPGKREACVQLSSGEVRKKGFLAATARVLPILSSPLPLSQKRGEAPFCHAITNWSKEYHFICRIVRSFVGIQIRSVCFSWLMREPWLTWPSH